MNFSAAAMTAGLLASYAFAADKLIESGLYVYTRALIWQIQNIYAIRMASVFMISWAQFGLGPDLCRSGWLY